mmetsp:Transcript_51661/g.112257  ORF Transcript_51661/g.112257 Transcript_51661/m.112257 type:complete len:108 (-) Transcript_51661:472-795(-)
MLRSSATCSGTGGSSVSATPHDEREEDDEEEEEEEEDAAKAAKAGEDEESAERPPAAVAEGDAAWITMLTRPITATKDAEEAAQSIKVGLDHRLRPCTAASATKEPG